MRSVHVGGAQIKAALCERSLLVSSLQTLSSFTALLYALTPSRVTTLYTLSLSLSLSLSDSLYSLSLSLSLLPAPMAKTRLLVGLIILAFSVLDASNDYTQNHEKLVGMYELKKGNFSVKFTNWGATVVSVILPDAKGNLDDVVLGFDSIGPYINDTTYFGAIVGRVANRIAGARFIYDGHTYKLVANEGKNILHGGHRGFSKVIWTVKEQRHGKQPFIQFTYRSFDGEQGFPGDIDVSVTYKLTGNYKMVVIMEARPRNKPTPINLAQHTYWNLAGQDSGDILSNTIQLFASHITPVDSSLIPTGQIMPVKGTPYDFLQPNVIGSRINELPGGYDINYVLDSPKNIHGLRKAALLKDNKTGRVLELWTNQPGLQFYTSNMLNNVVGKNGHVYQIHDAVALETQGFPDSVNHPSFPSQIVNPGQVYRHHMLYKFSFV